MKRIYEEINSFECERLKGNKHVVIRHQYVETEILGEYAFRGSVCSGASRNYKAEKRCDGNFAFGVPCMFLRSHPQANVFPPKDKTYVEYGPYDK